MDDAGTWSVLMLSDVLHACHDKIQHLAETATSNAEIKKKSAA